MFFLNQTYYLILKKSGNLQKLVYWLAEFSNKNDHQIFQPSGNTLDKLEIKIKNKQIRGRGEKNVRIKTELIF